MRLVTTDTRDPYWDTLKAILIVLVVLGHTGVATSIIYAFHMPLFIFISGYFSKKQSVSVLGGGNKRYIVLFLIFDIVHRALDVSMGVSLDFHLILVPAFTLWYLLCLVCWRIILQLLPQRVLDEKILVMTLSVLISLGAGFIPVGKELSFQRFCTFLPFFMLGFYAKQDGWVDKLRSSWKIPWSIILVGLLCMCYFAMPIFSGDAPYMYLADCGLRALQLIVALVLCFAIMNVVPTRIHGLTEVGRYTLLIYLLHPPMIRVMKIACLYTGIEHNRMTGIVMTIVLVLGIYSMRNLKVFRYLV